MPRAHKQSKRPIKRRWKTSRILTWVGLGCLAAAIAVLGFFAFAGGGEQPRRPIRQKPVISTERQVTVEVVDDGFEPDHLTVRPGTEITWEFKGRAEHDVTEDRGAFESGTLRRGDEFSQALDEPGTYYYYCTLHHGMQGTLVIQP